MKKVILSAAILTAGFAIAPQASAQRFAIKGYDNLGLGNAMSLTKAQPGQKSKSSVNSFGLDFGYTFWRSGVNSLEANIGFGYSSAGTHFSIGDMSYNYAAPAYADEDGNPYQRYYEISNLKQKATVNYFTLPIYLEYQCKPLRWLGIYAEAGVQFGFRHSSSIGGISGQAYSYGIFPEYDDLLIDEDYLDDFGTRYLNDAAKGDHKSKPFNCSVLLGAGLEFYAAKPVSFVVGVRYNQGLTQVFDGGYDITNSADYTAETVPVFYTVEGGTQVRSLADYTTKSRLNPLQLHMGINIRF